MLWQPKRSKLTKNHLLQPAKNVLSKNKLSKEASFTYGIKALNTAYISNNQIESVRKSIVRILRIRKLKGFYCAFRFRIYPHVSITRKPKGLRMGNGKGSHFGWFSVVQKGKILIEFEGLDVFWSNYLFNEIKSRLPLKLKFISIE